MQCCVVVVSCWSSSPLRRAALAFEFEVRSKPLNPLCPRILVSYGRSTKLNFKFTELFSLRRATRANSWPRYFRVRRQPRDCAKRTPRRQDPITDLVVNRRSSLCAHGSSGWLLLALCCLAPRWLKRCDVRRTKGHTEKEVRASQTEGSDTLLR